MKQTENSQQSFLLYIDFYDVVEDLTLEQKGLLFDCIFKYQIGEEYKTDDPVINIVMKQLIKTFERDKEKWLNIKEKRRASINKRWEAERLKKEKEQEELDKSIKKGTTEVKQKSKSKPKKEVKSFGSFSKVKLNEEQESKLVNLYGSKFNEAIAILDTYKESSGKNYKNDYAVLIETNWVYKKLQDQKINNFGGENLTNYSDCEDFQGF